MNALTDDEDTKVMPPPPSHEELVGRIIAQNPRAFNQRRQDYCQSVMPRLGNQFFSGLVLDDYDFSWLDLEGSTFTRCSLVQASFRHAILQGTRFLDCDLEGVDFRGVRCHKMRLTRCKCASANFAWAVCFPWRLRLKVLWQLFQGWR